MANKFNFDKVAQRMRNIDLSLDLANTAKTEFMSNFKNQGVDGQKWKPRKNNKDAGRNLLVKTGRLRRDVSNSVSAGHKNSNLSYTLIVNNPYASYNNEGTNKMPKRQFVGMTKTLNDKLLKKISQRLNKIWEV
jgi:phage gpG-like protein